ncbi:MAG: universal stress protein [Cyclobacteriaceae bacterium]|nr:universal stress protein [Cyclobacteriaceae bacterium]MDH4296155.1 universal stress protein [Cyclobacteriaceae bacterium]MDH5249748.1 universal stress protein [Cyclobacteriaceae bacterium]
MKILIPTDFSENAAHAIKYASVVAKALGAEVKLLCVCTPPLSRNDVAYELIEAEMSKAEKAAHKELLKISGELLDAFGVPCEKEVRTGSTVYEIINAASESKTDLIVMGTKGASGIGGFLFGTNTGEVIEATPCPVLAVPADAPIALPKKVVFATNFYDSDIQTLKELSTLVNKLNAELILLHVSKEKVKSERDTIEAYSKTVAVETGHQEPFYYVLQHDDTQKGINLFVDSVGADLIALSTRKRKEFEKLFDRSLTKKMAYQARLPLLAFHTT